MGWAGPAQPTGPDSAQKMLGRFRPKMDWADLGPKNWYSSLGQTRPRRQGRARICLHAERYSFCMQRRKKNKHQNKGGGRITWRGGGDGLLIGMLRWWCCGGGRWRCRGSRTAAPSGGAAISNGGGWGYCSSLLLRMPSSSFVFGGFPLSSRFVVKFPTPFQAFPSSPFEFISGSLFIRFCSLFLSISSSFGPLPFLLPFFCVLGSIYRAKRRGFLWLHMGGRGCGGWSAIRVQLSRRYSPVFCMARGGWSASGRGWRGAAPSVFWQGMRSRERQHTWRRKTHHFAFFPCCTSMGGRKRNSVVQNDTVPIFFFFLSFFFFFFFFWHETASF